MQLLFAAVLTALCLAIVYFVFRPRPLPAVGEVPEFVPASAQLKPYVLMTDNEKIQWILDTYFDGFDEITDTEAEKRREEDAFINSLPQDDSSCGDLYQSCPAWAANDECVINPEFMLYACPKSCSACALSEQDKFRLVLIYNGRPLLHKVYHGYPYPGNFPWLQKLYSLTGWGYD